MSTVASILLYGLAVLASCMIGFAAGQTKERPADKETENSLRVAAVALILFFVLAAALQVWA